MINEIWQGDVLELAKRLPDNSIHCIVTSPPYWALRDYGIAGQLGLESTPEEFIEKMVLIFRELRRALRPDGTLWLNLGDSYAGSPNGRSAADTKTIGKDDRTFRDKPFNTAVSGLKPKDLCGIPWRVALALQSDGWYLRSDIIWSKPNPMPESVTDRPTKAHEYVFLLTKSGRYFYDAEAIREPHTEIDRRFGGDGSHYGTGVKYHNGVKDIDKNVQRGAWLGQHPNGRNRRTVWEIATQPYPEAHFATYPEALVEPCILAGTSAKGVCSVCGGQWERVVEKGELVPTRNHYDKKAYGVVVSNPDPQDMGRNRARDGHRANMAYEKNTTGWQPTCKHNTEPLPAIVLDPFMGSGTTASVAKRLGRSFLGFELNPEYIKLAWTRIDNTQPPLIVENDIVVAQYNAPEQLSF